MDMEAKELILPLLAVGKEKATGIKVYLRDYGMLTQQIDEVRKKLHVAPVACFLASNAIGYGVLDARSRDWRLQVNRRLK